jgi:uncharacterized protein
MSQVSSDLVVRTKNEYDGAEPSGNSVAAINLLELSALTGENAYAERAERTVNSILSGIEQYPFAMPLLMVAGMRILQGSREIVLAGPTNESIEKYRIELTKRFLPGVSLLVNTGESKPLSEFARSQVAMGELPTAYVCKELTCELPTTEVSTFTELLEKI